MTELTFTIKNEGGQDLVWDIDENADWLSINNFAGTNESIINVSVDRNELNSFEDSTSIVITNTSTNNELIIKAKVKMDIESQLRKGLLAYYPFNGNSNDESGNDYHGVNDGAELTTDKHGNVNSAYEFDGTDMIDIPNHGKVNFLDNFSICVWVKINTSRNYNYILNKSENIDNQDLILSLNHNDTPQFAFRNGTIYRIKSNTHIEYNQWTNIIFTRDEFKNQRIYFNGILAGASVAAEQIKWETSKLGIGDHPNYHFSGNYLHSFTGKIDEVRIYDRVLLEDEIKYLAEN